MLDPESKDMYHCHPHHFLEIFKTQVNEIIGSYQIQHLKFNDKCSRAAERMAPLYTSYLGTHQNFWHVAPNTNKAESEVIHSSERLPAHNDTTYFALPAGIMVNMGRHMAMLKPLCMNFTAYNSPIGD